MRTRAGEWGRETEEPKRGDRDSYRVILPVSIESCMGAIMTRDLIRRGDNERLVFSATPLPQLTDVPVEGTYEVSLNEAAEPDETAAFEFDPNASPAQARDYVVAAASGTLMGALSVLWQQDLNLADARRLGLKDREDRHRSGPEGGSEQRQPEHRRRDPLPRKELPIRGG